MSSLQKKETLLIVDDSKFQRVVIRQSLGEYFNFAEAVSGEECIPGRCRDKWRRQCGDTGECTVGKRPELQSTKDDRIGGKRLWILQVLQQ